MPPARRSAPPRRATRCWRGTPRDGCSPAPRRPATRLARRRRSATSGSPRSSTRRARRGDDQRRQGVRAQRHRGAGNFGPEPARQVPGQDRDRGRPHHSACRNNVYFANSRFVGNGGSNIYFYRSTDHGATFSHGTSLTTSVERRPRPGDRRDANGHVYVTYDATLHQGNRTFDAILYNKSTDCGATFSPSRLLTTFNRFTTSTGRRRDPSPIRSEPRITSARTRPTPQPVRVGTAVTSRRPAPPATPIRGSTPSPRATADQYAATSDETIYVVFEQSIPGTQTPTGTTFGTIAAGDRWAGWRLLHAAQRRHRGHHDAKAHRPDRPERRQGPPVLGGRLRGRRRAALHLVRQPQRPVLLADAAGRQLREPQRGALARRVRVSVADRGTTIAAATRITDVSSNPNFEQFSGRTVPFLGDYIWVSSLGDTSFGVWTDYRNTVAGADLRESGDDDNDPGADVRQCRTELADGSITGDRVRAPAASIRTSTATRRLSRLSAVPMADIRTVHDAVKGAAVEGGSPAQRCR